MAEQDHTETWITAARGGDSLALAKLLASYHPRLRAQAEALMDPAVRARLGPDDILQEVYLRVFRHIDRFEDRGPRSFLNWVYTILEHTLVDARRGAHRQIRDVDREAAAAAEAGDSSYCGLLDRVYANSDTPSRLLRRQEAVGALLASLSNLSDSYRHVVQLRFLEGLSVGEVAARLGISKAAVVTRTKRALTALRGRMDELGEFTHGA
ncbi:MAG TPA: RNA polymerase sigma factor [Phycisphaerae bacterium]|nr:RNA polymerase sigma factor [Phycisphaerae bacterium]